LQMVIIFGTVRTLKTVDASTWYGLKDVVFSLQCPN
jgi:hypothetical protein